MAPLDDQRRELPNHQGTAIRSTAARVVCVGCAIFLLAIPNELCAQSVDVTQPSARADSIIVATEAAGATYPRMERTKTLSVRWHAESWWGSAERRCHDVRGSGPARSGEFIIGGQLGGDRPIYPRVAAKIWWAPFHNSESMDSLVIVGARLSSPMQMRLALGTVAFPHSPDQYIPPAEREYFYPSGTIIPDWGTWLLVATSGPNWGCFIVTLGRPVEGVVPRVR